MFDLEKVKKFRNETVEEYKDRTIIGEAISKDLYDPEEHDLDFFQTGIRTGLPKRFFTEGHANIALSSEFARSVYISERNHILRGLEEDAESDEIPTVNVSEFSPSEIKKAIEEIRIPTDVFLPGAFSEELHSWIGKDALEFDITATYLETESGPVRIRWVPTKHEFENIFVVNSDRLHIVQKQEKYAGDVDYINEIDECKLNAPDDLLMTYFGEIKDDPDEFDFFIRTVVSNPITSDQSASMIDTSSLDVDFSREDE